MPGRGWGRRRCDRRATLGVGEVPRGTEASGGLYLAEAGVEGGGKDQSGVQAVLQGVPGPGSQFPGISGRLRCPWSRPPGPRPLRCDMGRDSLSAALPARWGLLLFFFFPPRASAPTQLGRGGLSPRRARGSGAGSPRGRGGRGSGGTCPGVPSQAPAWGCGVGAGADVNPGIRRPLVTASLGRKGPSGTVTHPKSAAADLAGFSSVLRVLYRNHAGGVRSSARVSCLER